MKVLHTADLHLKQGEDSRLEVLQQLVLQANEQKAGAFIIAGDLFDSDKDASILGSAVKGVLDRSSCPVIIIPGNHDAGSFGPDHDYGGNVIQAYRRPCTNLEIGRLRIAAIPYHQIEFSECVKDLPPGTDVLVVHGTVYDQSFIFPYLDEEGDDVEKTYMPMMPANLEGLCRYCALGHLHARSIQARYHSTQVVYPGAPVALNTKCDTERTAALVDIDVENTKTPVNVKMLALEKVPFWQRRSFFVFPGYEEKIVSEIRSYLDRLDRSRIMPDIEIAGFISSGGRQFNQALAVIDQEMERSFTRHRLKNDRIQAWDKLLEHDLARRFVEKTGGLAPDIRFKIFELVFPVFSDALD